MSDNRLWYDIFCYLTILTQQCVTWTMFGFHCSFYWWVWTPFQLFAVVNSCASVKFKNSTIFAQFLMHIILQLLCNQQAWFMQWCNTYAILHQHKNCTRRSWTLFNFSDIIFQWAARLYPDVFRYIICEQLGTSSRLC